MRQLKFKFANNYKKEFGGELLAGKRKSKRPLSTKKPIHLVIRSSQRKVFLPNNKSLQDLIQRMANRFNIKIYDLALNWSHIHAVILLKDRADYAKFIRALTSIMADRVRKKLGSETEIFCLRPYTRILEWGRDFKNALNYTWLNYFESFGWIKRSKSKKCAPKSLHCRSNNDGIR